MNKILLIIRREFLTRIRKTSFIVLTLLMPFLFVGIIATPVLLSRIGNDETARKIAVIDPTGRYAAAFKPDARFALTVDSVLRPNYKSADSPFEAVVEIRGDLSQHPDALSISGAKEVQPDLIDYVENNLDEAVRQEKLRHYNIPQLNVIVSDMQRNVKASTKKWDANGRDTTSSTALARGIGLVTTMLIYLFVMSYGMMVLQGVLEEKTNRIMEIMVSSVRPFQLMMGKIIGIALVGITQLAIWGVLVTLLLTVGSVLFGFSADGGATAGAQLQGTTPALPEDITQALTAVLNLPLLEILLLFLLYFIGGYLLFASFLAAVGSAVNSQEDSTQFTLPVTLILVFGMYAAIGSGSNTDGPLAFWSSLFPLTSPIVMMVRVPFGVPIWQVLLSLTLLYGSAFGMTWLAGKIYRVGILMYGKKPTVREILKWVRYR